MTTSSDQVTRPGSCGSEPGRHLLRSSRSTASAVIPYFVRHLIPALVVAVAATGCATLPPTPSAQSVTTKMLLDARPILADQILEPLPDTNVLELTPKMLEFLDRVVDKRNSDYAIVRHLIRTIMFEEGFGLQYNFQTRTAVETFEQKSGNCLSFTNMFVAMARHLGIKASFQEVDIPPDWALQGSAFVLSRHINVMVNLPWEGKHVVDFNQDDFQAKFDTQTVSDRRALAHYYNNKGVEQLQAGANIEALRYFRKAIDTDRSFSPTWANLGTLYLRLGYLDYAESAYFYALARDARSSVAMSNLVSLYEQRGDSHRADLYESRVKTHRMRNPYYRYQLGRQAYLNEDYEQAVGHLRSAIRLGKNEHRFYYQLGLTYLELGQTDKARRSLNKAIDAATDDVKRHYKDQLENLLLISSVDNREANRIYSVYNE